ncbi:MAG: tRNA pseudouridine(55) synthase TruB, partial [Ignavibacteriales bacterium]|nr:tRNA pseudouridine(55) synthase TruB [Ignavibacteriales bacterium]
MITKTKLDFSNVSTPAGDAILMDKEIGWTSFDVIRVLRKILNTRKIGHAGTLDPNATGLLIICTGKQTKKISEFQNLGKTYTGVITLGARTETYDTESDFIEQKGYEGINEEHIESVRNTFIGKISQRPPMYSAVKHKGKPLYKYARKGIEIERIEREVIVNSFDIKKIDLPDLYFEIECSKGTYIRTLADDFGNKLGCGAYLKEL